MSKFGENLSRLRKAARLTQKEVAEKLGVNVHTFIGYETAGHEPKFDLLIKMADFFGVSVDDLIRGKAKVEYTIECKFVPVEK